MANINGFFPHMWQSWGGLYGLSDLEADRVNDTAYSIYRLVMYETRSSRNFGVGEFQVLDGGMNNLLVGGTPSASHNNDLDHAYGPHKAFNGVWHHLTTTDNYFSYTTAGPVWLQYTLPTPVAGKYFRYFLKGSAQNAAVVSFEIQGSNDGETFTTLFSKSGIVQPDKTSQIGGVYGAGAYWGVLRDNARPAIEPDAHFVRWVFSENNGYELSGVTPAVRFQYLRLYDEVGELITPTYAGCSHPSNSATMRPFVHTPIYPTNDHSWGFHPTALNFVEPRVVLSARVDRPVARYDIGYPTFPNYGGVPAMPRAWTFEISNDNTLFTEIHDISGQTDWMGDEIRTYT